MIAILQVDGVVGVFAGPNGEIENVDEAGAGDVDGAVDDRRVAPGSATRLGLDEDRELAAAPPTVEEGPLLGVDTRQEPDAIAGVRGLGRDSVPGLPDRCQRCGSDGAGVRVAAGGADPQVGEGRRADLVVRSAADAGGARKPAGIARGRGGYRTRRCADERGQSRDERSDRQKWQSHVASFLGTRSVVVRHRYVQFLETMAKT
jgi:hypothetical protein